MSYKIQIRKNIGGLETKEIEINENSLLTIEEASKIFDALFECGEITKTKALNPATGQEVEAYYLDHTEKEEREHVEAVLLNTAYSLDCNGEEMFKMDFLKWRKLVRDISVEEQKRAGDYSPLDRVRNNKMVKDKRELWDRIKTVFEHREPKQQSVQSSPELDTEEVRKYFARAINIGYMKKEGNGYRWLFGGNKGQVRLGYFCNKVFLQPRPINKLEQIFGVKKLSASITNAGIEATRADVKKWRDEMDNNIFKD